MRLYAPPGVSVRYIVRVANLRGLTVMRLRDCSRADWFNADKQETGTTQRWVLILAALLAPIAPAQCVPVHLTSEQDHQRTMELLHISPIRYIGCWAHRAWVRRRFRRWGPG